MDILQEIVGAQKDGAMFVVLIANQVKAFNDADQCEEYAASLGGQQFAVLRLLWTGGIRKEPAAGSNREANERHRREADALARAGWLAQFSAPKPAIEITAKATTPQFLERLPSPVLDWVKAEAEAKKAETIMVTVEADEQKAPETIMVTVYTPPPDETPVAVRVTQEKRLPRPLLDTKIT